MQAQHLAVPTITPSSFLRTQPKPTTQFLAFKEASQFTFTHPKSGHFQDLLLLRVLEYNCLAISSFLRADRYSSWCREASLKTAKGEENWPSKTSLFLLIQILRKTATIKLKKSSSSMLNKKETSSTIPWKEEGHS